MEDERSTTDEPSLQYYGDEHVVKDYDRVRFSSRSGRILNLLQQEVLLQALPTAPTSKTTILDAGCGTGRFLIPLAGTGARLVGMDTSVPMLLSARERIRGADYLQANVMALPFSDDVFDLAICVWVINHLKHYEEAVSELCRISKQVVICVPNRRSLLQLTGVFKRLGGARLLRREIAMARVAGIPPPFSKNFRNHHL